MFGVAAAQVVLLLDPFEGRPNLFQPFREQPHAGADDAVGQHDIDAADGEPGRQTVEEKPPVHHEGGGRPHAVDDVGKDKPDEQPEARHHDGEVAEHAARQPQWQCAE